MRILILCVFSIITFPVLGFSQESIDVIYLKNGDVRKGTIIENVPNEYIKLETEGGSIFNIKYSDIAKFTKEKREVKRSTYDSEDRALKISMYESQKKNNATAILWSCLITSAGHAYAGNWGRGLLFSAGTIACIVGAWTLGVEEETYGYYYTYTETKLTSTFWIFYGLAAAIRIWEVIDASNEVDRYNKKLYEKIVGSENPIGLNLIPDKNGARVLITYKF